MEEAVDVFFAITLISARSRKWGSGIDKAREGKKQDEDEEERKMEEGYLEV